MNRTFWANVGSNQLDSECAWLEDHEADYFVEKDEDGWTLWIDAADVDRLSNAWRIGQVINRNWGVNL